MSPLKNEVPGNFGLQKLDLFILLLAKDISFEILFSMGKEIFQRMLYEFNMNYITAGKLLLSLGQKNLCAKK
jgi:hypothetical protein